MAVVGLLRYLARNAPGHVSPDHPHDPVPFPPYRQHHPLDKEVRNLSVGVPAGEPGIDSLVVCEPVPPEVVDEAGVQPRCVPRQRTAFPSLEGAEVERAPRQVPASHGGEELQGVVAPRHGHGVVQAPRPRPPGVWGLPVRRRERAPIEFAAHATLRRAELEVRVGAPGSGPPPSMMRTASRKPTWAYSWTKVMASPPPGTRSSANVRPCAPKMSGEARPLPGGVSRPGVRRERAVAAPLVPYLGARVRYGYAGTA